MGSVFAVACSLVLIPLSGVGLLLVYVVVYHLYWRWQLRHIPGPAASLLFGNLLDIMRSGAIHIAMTRWAKQYGPLYKMFLGGHAVVVVTDVALGQSMLVKRFATFHNRTRLRISSIGGKNWEAATQELFFARDAYWGIARSAAQPLFHTASLSSFSDPINKSAALLCDRLREVALKGGSVDVQRYLGYLTLDVIGKAAFGVDIGSQAAAMRGEEDSLALVRAVKICFERVDITGGGLLGKLAQIVPPPLAPAFIWMYTCVWPDEDVRLQNWARGVTFGVATNLLRSAKKALGAGDGTVDDSWKWWDENKLELPYKDVVPAENSIIHHMLKVKSKDGQQGLTDVQIVAQCHDLLTGGYETTAITLAITLFCIAKHREAAENVLSEIDAWGRDRPVVLEDFASFPETEAFLKEVMRLYPAGPFTGRETGAPVQLGGYQLPPNISVFLNTYGIMYDDDVYPEASKFDPSRFLKGDPRANDGWLAFGVGPRMCVGAKLALMEAKLVLIRVLQQYDFDIDSTAHPDDALAMKLSLTWGPASGVHLKPRIRT